MRALRRTVLVIVLAAAACSSNGGSPGPVEEFTDADRSDFLDECAAEGGVDLIDVCVCTWERVTETMSAERYHLIDAAISGGDELPPELIEECVETTD